MGLVNAMADSSLCLQNPKISLASIDVVANLTASGTQLSSGCEVTASATGSISFTRNPRVRNDLDASFLDAGKFYFYNQGCCGKTKCSGRSLGKGESGEIPVDIPNCGSFSYASCPDSGDDTSGDLSLYGSDLHPTYSATSSIGFQLGDILNDGTISLLLSWGFFWHRSDIDPTLPLTEFGASSGELFTLDHCQDLFDPAGFDVGLIYNNVGVITEIASNIKFIKAA